MRRTIERFTVPFEGRGVHFRRQSAAQRLSHLQRACALMPQFGRRGLGGEEAYALAYNCVLLCQTLDGPDRLHTPAGALRRYTLGQIAELCRLYWEHGEEPFDERKDDGFQFDEYSVNENFPEEEFLC